MPDRSAMQDRLVRIGGRVLQAERGEEVFAQHSVVRLAAEYLEQAAEDRETRVVVGEQLAGREELVDLREGGSELLDGVVALAGLGEDVTFEAGLMAEELPDGDDAAAASSSKITNSGR